MSLAAILESTTFDLHYDSSSEDERTHRKICSSIFLYTVRSLASVVIRSYEVVAYCYGNSITCKKASRRQKWSDVPYIIVKIG